MKTIFKVGDRVFDIRYGWGEVVEIDKDENTTYPVFVNFNNFIERYTLNGLDKKINETPILSFTEYTLQGFSQERPKKEPEIGSLCLFSDDEEEFNNNIGHVGRLESIDKDLRFPYSREGGSSWIYCKQIKIEEI